LLIAPVHAQLPRSPARLTLLLDGVLWQLPFAALMTPQGTYLAEEFALKTVPAAGFVLPPAAPQVRQPGFYLLVGAPATMPPGPTGRALPPLPSARKELERVAAIVPSPHRLLVGVAARKPLVLEASAQARVLHLATHALIDARQPFRSALVLADRERLSVGEIYRLRLRSELVVLSACGSGSGAVTADGLLGFARAFLYAGAEGVLAPVWDIPDDPTMRLVDEFYRQYLKGLNQAAALRTAQLKLLRDLRAGRVVVSTPAGAITLPEHPALWAGFVLQGGR
jgi:CHAT domain-containing protein